MRLLSLAFLCLFFLTACDKEIEAVNADALIGNWTSDHILVATNDGRVLLDTAYRNHHLGIGEDRSFYYTYVNGDWELEGCTLHLLHRADLNIEPWTYEVLSTTTNQLVIRREGRPHGVNVVAPGVVTDMEVVVTETFIR